MTWHNHADMLGRYLISYLTHLGNSYCPLLFFFHRSVSPPPFEHVSERNAAMDAYLAHIILDGHTGKACCQVFIIIY